MLHDGAILVNAKASTAACNTKPSRGDLISAFLIMRQLTDHLLDLYILPGLNFHIAAVKSTS